MIAADPPPIRDRLVRDAPPGYSAGWMPEPTTHSWLRVPWCMANSGPGSTA